MKDLRIIFFLEFCDYLRVRHGREAPKEEVLDSTEEKNIRRGTDLLFSEAKQKALGVLLGRKSDLFVALTPT